MSRRGRALGFLLLALVAAAGAAAIADGYGRSALRGYGPLRPVVVVNAEVEAGKRLGPGAVAAALRVRRVPERFVPPDALLAPREALGLVARATLPAGSYLLAAQLGRRRRGEGRRGALGKGRRPVQIEVGGAAALLATGGARGGAVVDVVVTGEPTGAGPGRTYIAAARVPLLALRPEPEGPGSGGTAAAILALTRRQALRLIAAQSFAREVTLLPDG
jgi:Flp pilus assembly protein CpaB